MPGWLVSKPGRCYHAVQHEGLVGGQSWQHPPGVLSSPQGTQSQCVPKLCSYQPAVCWAALSSDAFPPIITGDPSLTAFRTERVRRQYRAMGLGAHFVPHLSPELNISGKEGAMRQQGWDGGDTGHQPTATSSNSHLSPGREWHLDMGAPWDSPAHHRPGGCWVQQPLCPSPAPLHTLQLQQDPGVRLQ